MFAVLVLKRILTFSIGQDIAACRVGEDRSRASEFWQLGNGGLVERVNHLQFVIVTIQKQPITPRQKRSIAECACIHDASVRPPNGNIFHEFNISRIGMVGALKV